jgi:hypothetical protein
MNIKNKLNLLGLLALGIVVGAPVLMAGSSGPYTTYASNSNVENSWFTPWGGSGNGIYIPTSTGITATSQANAYSTGRGNALVIIVVQEAPQDGGTTFGPHTLQATSSGNFSRTWYDYSDSSCNDGAPNNTYYWSLSQQCTASSGNTASASTSFSW